MAEPYIKRETTPSKLGPVPSIQRKETPSKLGSVPSIQRKETPSKLGSVPYIQREATPSRETTGSKGTPLKSDQTRRQAAQQEAKKMGIDTRGLSTREVKESISEKKAAQKELSDFIKDTVKNLPQNTVSNTGTGGGTLEGAPRKTEDRPSNLSSNSHKDGSKMTSDIEFFCYKNGAVGTIMLSARGFTPLP